MLITARTSEKLMFTQREAICARFPGAFAWTQGPAPPAFIRTLTMTRATIFDKSTLIGLSQSEAGRSTTISCIATGTSSNSRIVV